MGGRNQERGEVIRALLSHCRPMGVEFEVGVSE
jgi:hypothetical protein